MHGLRVGLYGDSFGTGSLPKINDEYDIGINYHWSKLLEQHYSCNITNYSVSGASIYHCYKQFMDTYHLHDINIFLITSVGRFNHEIILNNTQHRIVNAAHLDYYLKNSDAYCLTEDNITSLNEIGVWFKLLDMDYEYDMCNLMLEKVNNTRDNIIFVPCTDWTPKFIEPTDNTMYSLYEHQMNKLGLDTHNIRENTKWISGHLTPEYNKVFADILISRIDNGTWDDWVIPNVVFGSHKNEYFVSAT